MRETKEEIGYRGKKTKTKRYSSERGLGPSSFPFFVYDLIGEVGVIPRVDGTLDLSQTSQLFRHMNSLN